MFTIPQDDERFYVYCLRRSDIKNPDTGEDAIFYIGKGCYDRVYAHEKCARRSNECPHSSCKAIREVLSKGHTISTEILNNYLEENESFDLEREWITFGREVEWPLVNISKGGRGGISIEWDEERREARSQWMKEDLRLHPEKHKNFLQSELGIKRTPEAYAMRRECIIKAWEGNVELHEQQSEILRQRWANPEFRSKMEAVYADPEVKARFSESNKGKCSRMLTYKGFVSPDGVLYENVYNLAGFCREHGLSQAKMCQVHLEQRNHHQGWSKYNGGVVKAIELPTSSFDFIGPDGTVYQGITNLNGFCRDNGLMASCMCRVYAGKEKAHKGWIKYDESLVGYQFVPPSYAFVSPDNVVYQDIHDLSSFSREHNLDRNYMLMVHQGKGKGKGNTYKGWSLYTPSVLPPAQSSFDW